MTENERDNNFAFTNYSVQGIDDKVKPKNILEEFLFNNITQKFKQMKYWIKMTTTLTQRKKNKQMCSTDSSRDRSYGIPNSDDSVKHNKPKRNAGAKFLNLRIKVRMARMMMICQMKN